MEKVYEERFHLVDFTELVTFALLLCNQYLIKCFRKLFYSIYNYYKPLGYFGPGAAEPNYSRYY